MQENLKKTDLIMKKVIYFQMHYLQELKII